MAGRSQARFAPVLNSEGRGALDCTSAGWDAGIRCDEQAASASPLTGSLGRLLLLRSLLLRSINQLTLRRRRDANSMPARPPINKEAGSGTAVADSTEKDFRSALGVLKTEPSKNNVVSPVSGLYS